MLTWIPYSKKVGGSKRVYVTTNEWPDKTGLKQPLRYSKKTPTSLNANFLFFVTRAGFVSKIRVINSHSKICTLACVLKYLNGGKAVRAITLTHSVSEQILRQILKDSQWSMCRWYQSYRNNYREGEQSHLQTIIVDIEKWASWRMIWYLIMPNARSWSFRLLRIHRTSVHCLLENIVFPGFRQQTFFRLTSIGTCISNRSEQRHQRGYTFASCSDEAELPQIV